MKYIIFTLSFFIAITANSQITKPEASEVWQPEPRVVQAPKNAPPSDAIILFDGKNLNAWESIKEGSAKWKVADDYFTVTKGTGDIQTKESFGSVQLHIEWRTPTKIEDEGQGRGNSGVFFQNRYEVQILDSYENRTYSNGQAGSIYKQHIPLVNAMRAPGEWQVYDIIFAQPVFNKDSLKVKSGYLTVFHNGVLIQNNAELYGTTEYIGLPKNLAHGEGPIQLQDHGNPISYRNVWVRRLD